MLQTLQALGQIFIVQLRVEVMCVFLAESLSAEDVKARALLHKGHGDPVREVLLRDVLAYGPCGAPDELEPVAHRLTRPLCNIQYRYG